MKVEFEAKDAIDFTFPSGLQRVFMKEEIAKWFKEEGLVELRDYHLQFYYTKISSTYKVVSAFVHDPEIYLMLKMKRG